jgi:hypothetical protein
LDLTQQSVVSRADGWLTAWVGPELVMMSGENGNYISLSETGGRIWELLEDHRSISSLCEALAGEYEVAPETATDEVFAFIGQLKQQGAIHVETPSLE